MTKISNTNAFDVEKTIKTFFHSSAQKEVLKAVR